MQITKRIANLFKGASTENKTAQGITTNGFATLGLIEPLLQALNEQGYDSPTAIQQQAIPSVLEGRDVLGCAQTGTGKTAAFALPILQRLSLEKNPAPGLRALILAPTRELAIQIGESFGAYGAHTQVGYTVIFGGVGQDAQVKALQKRPAILVATPGRLLDLMQQKYVDLRQLSIFVLDEADRMLDMGFIHDVRKIIAALPSVRQNLLFSATMPKDIQALADRILKNPVQVAVAPVSSTAASISQSVYWVAKSHKTRLLIHILSNDESSKRTLVFTRTKHGANRVAEALTKKGIPAEAIHGNKSQSARQRALSNFKAGKTRVLVASDLAARGIDIDDVTHVFNFDLPDLAETYVHRIGRTGRASATGIAIAFCSPEERADWSNIERVTRQKIAVVEDHPYAPGRVPPPAGSDDLTDHEARGPRPPRPQARRPRPAPQANQQTRSSDAQADQRRRPRRRRRPASASQGSGSGRSTPQ